MSIDDLLNKIDIPEISEAQLSIMHFVISEAPIMVRMKPDAARDTPEMFKNYTKTSEDVDKLVALGLLEDVTDKNRALVESASLNNDGRLFSVFVPTKIGRLLFLDYLRRATLN